MKKVEIGSSHFTEVVYEDVKGPGGAYHHYFVSKVQDDNPDSELIETGEFADIHFQEGPLQENPINGCHHEDLLAIVIHRLTFFQEGDYRCRENAIVITKLEEAMHWLNHRNSARQKRGVEGTSEK